MLLLLLLSGVSPKSELSVAVGLDSAGEASEMASASKGLRGVVKAGLRKGGAVVVRFILCECEVEAVANIEEEEG